MIMSCLIKTLFKVTCFSDNIFFANMLIKNLGRLLICNYFKNGNYAMYLNPGDNPIKDILS